MRQFNPKATRPARAVQAWQILIGMAMNRQTTTYLGLSRFMYERDAPGVLDQILSHIAFWCIDNELPPLTAIVVGKESGRPGRDIPVDPRTFDEERERVYEFDRYNVYPPTEAELGAARSAHLKG